MKKSNDIGIGPVSDQVDEVQHFFSPVPEENYKCQNAEASVSLLDADAQLCKQTVLYSILI
jgi:hypothetical protein